MLPLFVRSIKFIIGGGVILVLAIALVSTLLAEKPTATAEHEFHKHPEKLALASDGPFGKWDLAQLQRGFQVYKEVCAQCHSLGLVSFREFEGLGYSEAQAKKIAADWATPQPTFDHKTGDRGTRPNLLSDKIPTVFYAGAGAPPDLTLMAKSRHGGASYIYSLLTGYQDQPKELLEKFPTAKTPVGLFYNPYFANLNISMPKPLTADGQVTYVDGTRATVPQMAADVSAFLEWTAEPTAQTRKRAGLAVVIFLIITTMFAFGAYRTVWAGVKH